MLSSQTEAGEMKNLNRTITRNEIVSVIKKNANKQNPGPDGFTSELY